MSAYNVLVKVYGNVYPVGDALLRALEPLCGEAVELQGDLLLIHFEGVWFPLEDVLEALTPHLSPDCQGKLDYLDLEAWTLTRHVVRGAHLAVSHVSLNAVMDYSGF